jgi:hypothetical protein
MTKSILLPPLAMLAAFALPAQADTLYKCQNAEGKTTYTNQKGGKNCEIVAQDKPVSTFSAPPGAKPAPKQATPADFPRVNGEQQKARDNDRRAILEQELASEQKNLEAAKKTLAEQEGIILAEERGVGGAVYADKRDARIRPHRDKVQLHERNLESIRREIGNLK